MENIESKAVSAARRFCERRGFEVLEAGWAPEGAQAGIVAVDEGTVCFIGITVREAPEGFAEDAADRAAWEAAALSWLAKGECELDSPVRFDRMDMVVLGNDRALLRHHANALSEG